MQNNLKTLRWLVMILLIVGDKSAQVYLQVIHILNMVVGVQLLDILFQKKMILKKV